MRLAGPGWLLFHRSFLGQGAGPEFHGKAAVSPALLALQLTLKGPLGCFWGQFFSLQLLISRGFASTSLVTGACWASSSGCGVFPGTPCRIIQALWQRRHLHPPGNSARAEQEAAVRRTRFGSNQLLENSGSVSSVRSPLQPHSRALHAAFPGTTSFQNYSLWGFYLLKCLIM